MKATITFDITPEEVNMILDKLREHRLADHKEWEENHPHPMPMPFAGDPFDPTTDASKKSKPN